ncbi:MAG TPA: BlaI/MecI/CopY family transcriptional regulator [Terriglobales bacterium]|jgi:BlaI family transcriptional regulator, penicillinase repressor
MALPRNPRPTESELGILRVLWAQDGATVREVHAALGTSTGYTTVLKLMQIMAEKGLVTRDEQQRAHIYRARSEQGETERLLVGDLVTRAFGGSAARMMMHLLDSQPPSPEELAALRKLLDDQEAAQR